jgi:uncharacterized small protein (DUF1192 family)
MTHVVEDNSSSTSPSALEQRLVKLEQEIASIKADLDEAPSNHSAAKGE